MKRSWLLIVLLVISFSSSVSKAQCLKIVRDSTYNSFPSAPNSIVTIQEYFYDNSDRVVKIARRYSGSESIYEYDTMYYNSDRLDSVGTYVSLMNKFIWSHVLINKWADNLLIEQIMQAKEVFKTLTYNYSGNTINSLTDIQIVSWNGEGMETTNIKDISFTGNNMTAGVLTYPFNPSPDPITLTYDTYLNQFYRTALNDDFLTYFSENNIVKIYSNASPETPWTETSYTYADGLVITVAETIEEGETKNISYVYDCIVTGTVASDIFNVVSAFPNPSLDGKFYVQLNDFKIYEILVVTSKGEVIPNVPYEINNSKVNIDLSNEDKGLYLVQLKGDNGMFLTKLIYQ